MLELLLAVSWRVLILALLAAAATWVLRRRPADLRHAIWLTALAAMLLLPALTWLLPPLPLLPALGQSEVLDLTDLQLAQVPATNSAQPVPVEPASRPIDWLRLLEFAYLALTAAALLRVALAIGRARRLLSGAEPVTGPHALQSLTAEAARQNLPAPLPALLESAAVRVPFTAGWRRPAVLLPADWQTWDDFRLRCVLAHELAHIRRADWATTVLAATNRALFWFHPLAWWLERHLAALAEEACDAAAIAATQDPEAYAGVVLHFAATVGNHPHLPATAMARTSKVGTRIDRILEGKPMWTQTITRGRWLALTILTMPLLYAAAALQQQQPPLPPPQAPVIVGGVPGGVPGGVVSGVAGGVSGGAQTSTVGDETKIRQLQALETRLAANPEQLDARVELLIAYLQSNNLDAYAKQVIWLVEHHPESAVHDTHAGWIGRARYYISDAATKSKIEKLWRQQAAANPSSAAVLRHAATYLFEDDPATALELLKSAKTIAPSDPAIDRTTISLYTLQAIAHVGRRNTPAAQAAADAAVSELQSSNDAALIGNVGTSLANFKLRLNASTPQQSVEAARARTAGVRELALKLLDRAIALEPANQDWKAARLTAQDASIVAVDTPVAPAQPAEPAALKPASEMPRRITVGGNVQQAMLVTAPRAEFPALARQARIQGIVQLSVIIGTDGRVANITVLTGHPLLAQAATDAVRQYVYKPTTLNGVAVEVSTRVDIAFTLTE